MGLGDVLQKMKIIERIHVLKYVPNLPLTSMYKNFALQTKWNSEIIDFQNYDAAS